MVRPKPDANYVCDPDCPCQDMADDAPDGCGTDKYCAPALRARVDELEAENKRLAVRVASATALLDAATRSGVISVSMDRAEAAEKRVGELEAQNMRLGERVAELEAEITQLQRRQVIAFVGQPREPVRWFARRMEAELREHDDKGGWSDYPPTWLLARLMEETGELANAIWEKDVNAEEVIGEAADVANFAMMIADVVRAKVE